MCERPGILEGKLVRIEISTSGTDDTVFEVEEPFVAKLGPAEDSDLVPVDPKAVVFSSLRDKGNGSYQMTIKRRGAKEKPRIIYIAKP